MISKIIIFGTLFFALPASAAAKKCEVYRDVVTVDVSKIIESKQSSLDSLLPLLNETFEKGKLTWNSFDAIKSLERTFSHIMEAIPSKKQRLEAQAILAKTVRKELPGVYRNPRDARDLTQAPIAEALIEMEFQKHLDKLNRWVSIDGEGPFFKSPKLPTLEQIEVRRNRLRREGMKIVKKQDGHFQKLKNFDGFSSLENFKAAWLKTYPTLEILFERLENFEFDVAIRRPMGARFWVPIVGFQNQRITGSSRGSYYPPFRDEVEASLTRTPLAEYANKDSELKPQYGFMTPKPELAEPFADAATGYGPDLWILKPSVVKSRTSFTPQDSFGSKRLPIADTVTVIDNIFLPMSARILAAAFVSPNEARSMAAVGYDYTGKNRDSVTLLDPKTGELESSTHAIIAQSYYLETQIWGSVTIEDVRAFGFREEPPSGEFLKELQSRKIEIWDYRGANPVRWSPPATL